MRIITLFILAAFFFQSNISAQSYNEGDLDVFNWDYTSPTIEVNYGISQPKHKSFNGKLSEAGLVEVKLGYSKTDENFDASYIIEFDQSLISFSNRSTETNNKSNEPGKYKSDTWMFGLAKYSGYGYRIGQASILPYYGNSFVWTNFNSTDLHPESDSVTAEYPLLRVNNSIRFGTAAEAGIKLQPVDFISINAGYETNVVFPRYLFWKHLVSGIIEYGAQSLVDEFVEKIMESSPAAGPVVSILLKGGIGYAFYKLKQEKMNWPMSSETPLTFESFKFGLMFSF